MKKLSRRAFARTTALAAATIATVPHAVAQTPAPAPATPPEVEARLAWIFGKYGARLDEQQRADIRRNLTGAQAGLDAMRAYPVDNSIEPATVFRVWRGGK